MTYHDEIPQHFVIDDELWETLEYADLESVCHNCGITYDKSKACYAIPVLNETYELFPREKTIVERERGNAPAERYRIELVLFLLHYLLGTTDGPLKGRPVSEKELKGGEMFFRGPHTLPTQAIARTFGHDPQRLLERGCRLKGKPGNLGDVSVELSPAPKIPITYVLWAADEEFPASVSVLFDPTIQEFLPLDIIYGVCIFTAHRLTEE